MELENLKVTDPIMISSRLLAWRGAYDVTHLQVARLAGIPGTGRKKIQNWESGKTYPDARDILVLCGNLPAGKLSIEFVYEGCGDRMDPDLVSNIFLRQAQILNRKLN